MPDVVAMRVTGHKTRSVFDRYDIVSGSDLIEAAHKLNALTGTIAGMILQGTLVPRGKIELPAP